MSSDLHVDIFSDALGDKAIDLVVSGSIGAVESVRFVRALRRLGADVTPWLTTGGAAFTTPMALDWASNNTTNIGFSGTVSHIAQRDACVVAPASADFIAKIAGGITSCPASALVASYLGMKKPVLIVPNMHASLFDGPMVAANLSKIEPFVDVLSPRIEEGKLKFPEPRVLADEVAHQLNGPETPRRALITMGSTVGYLDSVRYVSNYSTGRLGSLIGEELYRHGFATTIVHGRCKHLPSSCSESIFAETNDAMEGAIRAACAKGVDGVVMAASILDYVPENPQSGKLRSGRSDLSIQLVPTKKIIATLPREIPFKAACKLEPEDAPRSIEDLSKAYLDTYGLSLLVVNLVSEVSESEHKATLVFRTSPEDGIASEDVSGKNHVAKAIAMRMRDSLATR